MIISPTIRSTEYVYRNADGSNFLEAALALHDKGFSIIPLMPHDKLPNGKLLPLDLEGKATWKPYQTERATREQIVKWWTISPDSNIGIATGAVSNCIVVDVDSEEGAANLRAYGKMPRTPTSKTGKGWHSIIRHTVSGNRHELVPGVDIRGDGGYIVAPPSIHPSGRVYHWLVSPDDCELAEAPDWLLALLKPKERSVYVRPNIQRNPSDTGLAKWAQTALTNVADELAATPHHRNVELHHKAIRLGSIAAHFLLTETECHTALEQACYANGYIQEHKDGSFEATFNNGFNYGLTVPCQLPEADRPRISLKLPKFQTWQSVPIIVRGLINANVSPSSAPTLETIIEGDSKKLLNPEEALDVEQLYEVSNKLGRGLSKKSIREGLKRGANPHGVEFVTIFSPIQDSITSTESGNVKDIGYKKVTNSTGGRKREQYQLLPIAQILDNLISFLMAPLIKQMFPIKSPLVAPVLADFLEDLERGEAESAAEAIMDEYGKLIEDQDGYRQAWKRARDQYHRIVGMLRNPEFAPLPEGRYRNTPEYMTLCAKAIIMARGGEMQMSLADWSLRLGCTSQNVNKVLKRADIEVINNQYVERVVTDIGQIKNLSPWWDKEMNGKPQKVVSSLARGSLGIDNPNLVSWCEGELAKGATLTIRYNQPNRQRIKPAEAALAPSEEVKAPEVSMRLLDAPEAPKKPKSTKPPKKRETWREANERKLVELVAKSKNIPVKAERGRVTNLVTGEIQMSLDFLLKRSAEPEPVEAEEIKAEDTDAMIVDELLNFGGTVSAVYEAGTEEYERLAS